MWDDLTMRERADYIWLNTIRTVYNKYAKT